MTQAPARRRLGTGPALLSGAARPLVAALAIVAIGATTWLGVVDHRVSWANHFDLLWLYRLQHDMFGRHVTAMTDIADIGGARATAAITVLLVVGLYVLRRFRAAILAALAAPLAAVLIDGLIKPWVHRAPFGVDTYPSGHTGDAFALITVIGIVLLGPSSPVRSRAVRVTVPILAVAVGCLVAVGLVVAGFHFPTDTVGGAGVGTAVTCLLAFAIDGVASTARRMTT